MVICAKSSCKTMGNFMSSQYTTLKLITWMCILLVALVGWDFDIQESWQVLIENDVLQGGNNNATSPLEDILIRPCGMLFFDPAC